MLSKIQRMNSGVNLISENVHDYWARKKYSKPLYNFLCVRDIAHQHDRSFHWVASLQKIILIKIQSLGSCFLYDLQTKSQQSGGWQLVNCHFHYIFSLHVLTETLVHWSHQPYTDPYSHASTHRNACTRAHTYVCKHKFMCITHTCVWTLRSMHMDSRTSTHSHIITRIYAHKTLA